jgi:hypothetical protein
LRTGVSPRDGPTAFEFGATTAQIAEAFGWLPHTTRGALSRFCQMYNVEKLKVAGGTRYKIAS